MTTGAEAIQVVAEKTGLLQTTVFRAARALREAGGDQWPQAAGPGGGKNSRRVHPHHLTNLALTLTVAPISAAPEIITGMRQLVPETSEKSAPFLSGRNLGEALDFMIDAMSRRTAGLPDNLVMVELNVRRYGSRRPYAIFEAIQHVPDEQARKLFCRYIPAPLEVETDATPIPAAALLTVNRLPYFLFRTLAELWADTQAHSSQVSPSSPPGVSVRSKRKKAAGAPPPSDPPKPKQAARVCEAAPVHNWQTNTHAKSVHHRTGGLLIFERKGSGHDHASHHHAVL